MRIHYGKYVLADDDQAHASAFRVNDARSVDVTALVQSDWSWVSSRGNAKLTVSFSSTLQFPDEETASRFAVAWTSTLTGQANLICYWSNLRAIFTGAALQSAQAVQAGVSVIISYSFVSGGLDITGAIDTYQLNSGTTAERPASPADGAEYYDTDHGLDIIYDAVAAIWKDRLGTPI